MSVVIAFLFRMVVGLLLITTAWSKWRNWHGHKQTMEAYQLLPRTWIPLFLSLFLVVEVYVGITLMIVGVFGFNLVVGMALLFVYTLAIMVNVIRGHTEIACGCGSVLEHERLSWWMVGRNGGLILLLWLLWQNASHVAGGGLSGSEMVSLAMLAIGWLLVLGLVKEWQQIRSRLLQLMKS